MLAAVKFNCFPFDDFPLRWNVLGLLEVGIGRRDVVQALVIELRIVVLHPFGDASFEFIRQVVVFPQEYILESTMPALDFALGHRMIGTTTRVRHVVVLEPSCEFRRDVAWTVVAEQARPMPDVHLRQTRGLQCHLQRFGYIISGHRRAELPGQDVARVVVQHDRQIVPAPSNDLQIREVVLPELVGCRRRIGKRVGGFHEN